MSIVAGHTSSSRHNQSQERSLLLTANPCGHHWQIYKFWQPECQLAYRQGTLLPCQMNSARADQQALQS